MRWNAVWRPALGFSFSLLIFFGIEAAPAEDLVLPNGRTYYNIEFVAADVDGVAIRHGEQNAGVKIPWGWLSSEQAEAFRKQAGEANAARKAEEALEAKTQTIQVKIVQNIPGGVLAHPGKYVEVSFHHGSESVVNWVNEGEPIFVSGFPLTADGSVVQFRAYREDLFQYGDVQGVTRTVEKWIYVGPELAKPKPDLKLEIPKLKVPAL